jgi:predicted HTH transcriptional regulator
MNTAFGWGTNRVIEMGKKHGAPAPSFEERQGFLIVTFRAQMTVSGALGTSRTGSMDQAIAQVGAQVAAFCREPKPAKTIMAEIKLKHWKTFQVNYLVILMVQGILERTSLTNRRAAYRGSGP